MAKGRLILIPSTIGDFAMGNQFPVMNAEHIQSIKYFFVENPKPARAFLKLINPLVILDEIEFFQFDKHEDNQVELFRSIMLVLNAGNDVGVLSDAGCPGIADPGSIIVSEAHKHDIEVIPLVGPSSILLTLMASGLNGQNFHFIGYLPKDQNSRNQLYRTMVHAIRTQSTTYLFIETPYHTDKTFAELLKHIPGNIKLTLGMDLLSKEQMVRTKPIENWMKDKKNPVLKNRLVVFALGS